MPLKPFALAFALLVSGAIAGCGKFSAGSEGGDPSDDPLGANNGADASGSTGPTPVCDTPEYTFTFGDGLPDGWKPDTEGNGSQAAPVGGALQSEIQRGQEQTAVAASPELRLPEATWYAVAYHVHVESNALASFDGGKLGCIARWGISGVSPVFTLREYLAVENGNLELATDAQIKDPLPDPFDRRSDPTAATLTGPSIDFDVTMDVQPVGTGGWGSAHTSVTISGGLEGGSLRSELPLGTHPSSLILECGIDKMDVDAPATARIEDIRVYACP